MIGEATVVNDTVPGRWSAARYALLTSVLVAFVFGFPQLLYLLDGHRYALLQNSDEYAYAAHLRETLDGHWRAASPYVWEHKDKFAFMPYGSKFLLGAVGRVTGLDIDGVIILTRFAAAAGMAGLLFFIFQALTRSPGWAAVGTAVVLLEPGTFYYKPFYYVLRMVFDPLHGDEIPLVYSRFMNPLVMLLPFLACVLFLVRALATRRTLDVALAGIALGANFYVQPFYSTYLLAWLGLLLLVSIRDRQERWVLAAVIAIGLVTGGYAVVENFEKLRGPGVEVLTRFGAYLKTRGTFYLFHKGLIGTILVFAVLHPRKRSMEYRFFLTGMIAGYVAVNQHLITGREIHNYHYHYANAVTGTAGLVMLAHAWLAAPPAWAAPARWVSAGRLAGVTCMLWLTVNAVVLQATFYAEHVGRASTAEGAYPSNMKSRFARTIAWINANAPRDSVFVADPDLAFVIPVYTAANVFLSFMGDDAAAFMSDEELFERYVTYYRLAGLTAAEVLELVRFKPPVPFPNWKYGRTPAMQAKYDLTVSETFTQVLQSDALARDYVAAFETFSPARVAEALTRYRIDYLAVGTDGRRFLKEARTYFPDGTLEPVVRIDAEGIEIFHVSRRAVSAVNGAQIPESRAK